MKKGIKEIIALVMIMMVTTLTHSFADDQSSGCGLGWAVTKRKSILSSLVRAYTNATFSSTFGMTSGTSGCAEHSIVMKEKKAIHYTEANYHQLMQEMAEGQGEYVSTYAQVLGCSPRVQKAFTQSLKRHYGQIYTHDGVTPQEVYQNVKQQISHEAWATSCHLDPA
jgi:hypothetical protein